MSSNVKENVEGTESSENEHESKRSLSNENESRHVTVGNNYLLSKRRAFQSLSKNAR